MKANKYINHLTTIPNKHSIISKIFQINLVTYNNQNVKKKKTQKNKM